MKIFLGLTIPLLLMSCDNMQDVNVGKTSTCNGFQKSGSIYVSQLQSLMDSTSYCDAERLIWSYDSINRTVQLLHTRLFLNCAAQISVSAQLDNNTITVNETDTRDKNLSAGCACPFDTYIEVPDVRITTITVTYGNKSATLSLKDKTGIIVLDTIKSPFCE